MIILLSILFFTQSIFAGPMSEKDFVTAYDTAFNALPETVWADKQMWDREMYKIIQKANAYPSAVAIGVMGRCQKGVGVCAGAQVNIGNIDGKLSYSSYVMSGLSLGLAEIYKVEFFLALCYGDCLSSYAQGIFVSAETGATIIGGVSSFIEVGTDFSDLFSMNDKKPSLESMWEYKTAYIGLGYNIGAGIGFSGTVYYYQHLKTEPLSELSLGSLLGLN